MEAFQRYQDVVKKYKKAMEQSSCMVPDSMKQECEGKIVKAHTIPRMCLKKISKNGFLLGFIRDQLLELDINDLSNLPNKKMIEPKKIGINQASVFTGFCQKHDNELFKPIEKDDNISLSKKECFLYSYRSLCREYFLKIQNIHSLNYEKTLYQEMQGDLKEYSPSSFLYETSLGLRDLEHYKKIFDEMLLSKNFENFKSFVITFKKIPSVMASGCLTPIYDFKGGRFKKIEKCSKVVDEIFFNITSYKGKGYAIFSWVEQPGFDPVAKKFVQSLIDKVNVPTNKKTDAIILFLYSSCENTYCSFDWWNSLGQKKRNILSNLFYRAVSPYEDFPNFNIYRRKSFDDWDFEKVTYLG